MSVAGTGAGAGGAGSAALAGFTTQRAENIRLALGEATVLDFELEIAARPEAITVVAEPVLGAMRHASLATVVSQGEIESLPTNGLNFVAFSLIRPGVNADRTPQQGRQPRQVSPSSASGGGPTTSRSMASTKMPSLLAACGDLQSGGAGVSGPCQLVLCRIRQRRRWCREYRDQERHEYDVWKPVRLLPARCSELEGTFRAVHANRFVLSGDYRLPGGVTVSAIVTVGSGRPYNITAGRDLNEDGAAGNDRPWRQKNDLTTRIGRNAGLLAGTSTVNVRVAKRLIAGDRALDLIGEVFNLFNHTNYTAVDAVFGDGAYPNEPRETFGRFTKAGPPFQAQLAMKFSF